MKKGFTLLELLIATSIFAVVMLITTATFTMASSYSSKLGEARKTSLASKKVAEMISKDIRLANGEFIIYDGTNVPIGQLTLLDCPESSANDCSGIINSNTYSYRSASFYGLAIVQKNKNILIIYRTVKNGDNFDIYRQERDVTRSDFMLFENTNVDDYYPGIWQKLNSDISLDVKFWGYSANKTNAVQQPHIYFDITAQSINYDTLKAPFRSRIQLRTAVTSRDYN